MQNHHHAQPYTFKLWLKSSQATDVYSVCYLVAPHHLLVGDLGQVSEPARPLALSQVVERNK